ncbi:hypothetical protein BSKO_03552 [Bryopsis sp. KO-2023]|nr:hypothetical protein BSKO_03552 [Bryopsis sp. KO-2023]
MWGGVLSHFDLLVHALLLIASWSVAEGISKNVSDAREFRTALEEQDVDRIFLDDSVFLRPYDGWDLVKTGPIKLARSVSIEGDRQWGRHITIDLGDILTGDRSGLELFQATAENVTISFQSVHVTGLPFAPGNRDPSLLGVSFAFNSSIIEVFYSPTDSHPNWLAWLSNTRAQRYPAQGNNPDVQLLRAVNKTFCDKWCKVECPTAEYVYLEDVAHHMGVNDQELIEQSGGSVEDTGVLYGVDCMLILVSINRKVVTDSSSFEMALRDPAGHRTTITIEGEVTLWEANLGCPFTLLHDVTIQGSSSDTPPTDVLDFNVIRNCTVIPPSTSLTIQNLILAKAVLYMPVLNLEYPWQSIAVFFNPRPNSAVTLDNVVWHVHYLADSPLSAATIKNDLSGKGRGEVKDAVGPLDSSEVQLVSWVDTEWCEANYTAYGDSCRLNERCVELTKCPHDGVFVKDVQYDFLPPGVFLPPGAHYRIMRSLLIPSTTDRMSIPHLDLETKGRRKTPVLIIVILVGLGVAGFAIAASALILSKVRSKSRAEKHLSYGTDTDGFYSASFDPNDASSNTYGGFQAKQDLEMQNTDLRKSSAVVVVEDSKFAIAAQRAAEKMFGNISLGKLLGQGAFGRVYKATWNGAVVAVKVIEMTPEGPNHQTSIDREVNLLLELRHPNIVNLYRAAARQMNKNRSYSSMMDVGDVSVFGNDGGGTEATESENPPTSSPQKDGVGETWMVMEFCDQGTLRDLLKNDFFFEDERKKSLKMEWVLYTCQDIARGFQYLHEQNLIHGDLKPHNIFLSTNGQDSRRFIAKIGDFGVSRKMQTSQVYTATLGTMAYMPPELLGQSKLTDKADVYAYGIIMWQLTTGDSPFAFANAADVWRKVVIENFRPAFPNYVPDDYRNLASRCWDTNPHNRPIFDEVMSELSTILQKVLYTA